MTNDIRKPLRAKKSPHSKVLSFCTNALIILGIAVLLLVLLELGLALGGVRPILYELARKNHTLCGRNGWPDRRGAEPCFQGFSKGA